MIFLPLLCYFTEVFELFNYSLVYMLYSHEFLLDLLQKHFKQKRQINQIHSLLITSCHLFLKPSSQPSKWIKTLLYNTLIRAHLNFGNPYKSLLLFTYMLSHQAPPNNHTFPSAIKAISSSPTFASFLGRPVHNQAIKRGLSFDPFVHASFVSFYAQFGHLQEAQKVFEEIPEPCMVTTNAMLDAYGKNGEMESAVLLFEKMSERDVFSWTSVINGFGKCECFNEAMWFFKKMLAHEDVIDCDVSPGEATFVSVLCSCSNLDGGGCLYQGKQIHGYIVKNGIELTAFLGTALISMYGKTGCMDSAFEVFNGMSDKKVCTWNALMSSLACNGREKETLSMFEKMRVEGFHPNEITFVALLTACARAGLVELGLKWYQAMLPDFRVIPRMEHYGCVVDLLGRAGLLAEAEEFVKSMPFQPDATVLGALLGACRVHANVDLADAVGRRLLTLQPQHSGRYVVLSNIYAEAGKWDHASKIRKAMVDGRIRKTPAQSCVERF